MVKSLREILRLNINPRIVGFDDAPFASRPRERGSEVESVGVVTSMDRFEGMLYVRGLHQDGLDAQERLREAIVQSKFHAQVHAVLLDGITMGGMNVIDIRYLSDAIKRPVISVMRREPKMEKMMEAMKRASGDDEKAFDERMKRMKNGGPIHQIDRWIFQFQYCSAGDDDNDNDNDNDNDKGVLEAKDIVQLLNKSINMETNSNQKIPECLRLAHLIGSAIKSGQSSSNA